MRRVGGDGWVLALVLLLVGAAACGGSDGAEPAEPGATAPEPVRGGELVVGLSAETNDWNPALGQWASSGGIVARAIYDPLAVIDGDGEVQPYLAESFTPDDAFTEWTVTVRDGVEFHDGTPLDAAALARNLEERRESPLTASAYTAIEDVAVDGDRSVVVSMSQPWSTFPLAMAGQGGYVAAPATFDDPEGGTRPVGTGPFRFVSWEPDRELVVERNADYWREGADGEPLPLLDGATFRILSDPTSRQQALEAGDVDVIEVDDVGQLADLRAAADAGDLQLTLDEARSSSLVVLNAAAPPFDDPLAREAVAVAVDPARVAEEAYRGLVPAADGPLEPESLGRLDPEEIGYPAHDLDAARTLAAEYEAATGAPLAFTFTTLGDPLSRSIATVLRDTLAEAGIAMEIDVLDQTAAIGAVLTGDYQAAYYAVRSVPSLDAAYAFYGSEPQPIGAFGLNVTRVDAPELRAALAAARATDDPDLQAAAYRDAQVAIADARAWIFLVRDVVGLAAANDVEGLDATTVPGTDVDATYFASLPFLTEVWLDR